MGKEVDHENIKLREFYFSGHSITGYSQGISNEEEDVGRKTLRRWWGMRTPQFKEYNLNTSYVKWWEGGYWFKGLVANRETRVQSTHFSTAVGGSMEEELKKGRAKCLRWLIFPFFSCFSLITTNSETMSGKELEGIPNKRDPIATGHLGSCPCIISGHLGITCILTSDHNFRPRRILWSYLSSFNNICIWISVNVRLRLTIYWGPTLSFLKTPCDSTHLKLEFISLHKIQTWCGGFCISESLILKSKLLLNKARSVCC